MADPSQPPDLEVNLPVPPGLWITGEEPYRILVIADFAGAEHGMLSGPLLERVVSVTADTFDEVMAAAAPTVQHTLGDPLTAGGGMVEVHLRFDSLRAFAPEALVRQVPATRALLDISERIVARLRGQVSASELTQGILQAAASDAGLSWIANTLKRSPEGPVADAGAIDALLDQIDLGEDTSGGSGRTGTSPLASLVSAAAGPSVAIPAGEAAALRQVLTELDQRISLWLTVVLHSAPVRHLESAWRALALLVSRVDFRKGVRVSVLHASRDTLVERFSALVIDPVFDEGAEAPHLIAVDTLFGNTAPDLATLDGLAQHAASLPAVVLVGLAPDFFGVKQAWQVGTLPPLVNLFDQWQFAKWKTFRGQPYAQHMGVVFGRGLLRTPFRRESGAGLDFAFHEPCMTGNDLVWASGPLLAACVIARSVAETGWPTAVVGRVRGRIDGLPVAQAGEEGDKQIGPADTRIPQPKIEEMGLVGINVVTGLREGDAVMVWNWMTAARPQRADPSAMFEVTLPYLFFAGRLATLLWRLKPHLETLPPDQVCGCVATHVGAWLKIERDSLTGCVTAQIHQADDASRTRQLALTVVPPPTLLPGGVPIVLGYQLPPVAGGW